MLIRNVLLLFLSLGLLPAAEPLFLTPQLEQLPPGEFNHLLVKSLTGDRQPSPGALKELVRAVTADSRRCAIRLREYRVPDPDPAASRHPELGVARADEMAVAPPLRACRP